MNCGIKIEADELFNHELMTKQNFDCIVLPGGLEGARAFRDCPLLIKTLKLFLDDKNKLVAAICASPSLVLNHHNLLNDYSKVTSYPTF